MRPRYASVASTDESSRRARPSLTPRRSRSGMLIAMARPPAPAGRRAGDRARAATRATSRTAARVELRSSVVVGFHGARLYQELSSDPDSHERIGHGHGNSTADGR